MKVHLKEEEIKTGKQSLVLSSIKELKLLEWKG